MKRAKILGKIQEDIKRLDKKIDKISKKVKAG